MLFKRQYYILQQNIVTNYLISNLDNVCVCVCVCVLFCLYVIITVAGKTKYDDL